MSYSLCSITRYGWVNGGFVDIFFMQGEYDFSSMGAILGNGYGIQ